MSADRIPTGLQQVIQSIAQAIAPAATSPTAPTPRTDGPAPLPEPHPDLPPAAAGHRPNALPPPQPLDGFPPPAALLASLSAPPAAMQATILMAAARLLEWTSPDLAAGRVEPDAPAKAPVVTTVSEVRPNLGVVETVFVDGVPHASQVIASDDRPRVRLDGPLATDRPVETACAAVDATGTDAASRPATPATTETGPVLSPGASPSAALAAAEARALRDLERALAGLKTLHGALPASGIVPSSMYNAAMIPGWPPPRNFEPTIGGQEPASDAEYRAEAIAALLVALGIEPNILSDASPQQPRHRRRWLTQIGLLIAAISVIVSTIAEELRDMQGVEAELDPAGFAAGRRMKRNRLYLE